MRVQLTLHRFACLTAIATFALLIAGGLVTSTDSGLAVPDWPLSYGTWFPPMVGGIVYEHGHRMVAAVVGVMILVLDLWLKRTEPRRWVQYLGDGALAGVILQALLGGATDLLMLPPQISIAHAVFGPAVFCLVVCLAWCTQPAWPVASTCHDGRFPMLRWLGVAVALLVFIQLLLGAVIRHTGYAVFVHIIGAVVLGLVAGSFAGWAAPLRLHAPTVCRYAMRLLALIMVQLVLGASVFMHRGSVGLRTAHVALGALVLAQAVVLAWDTIRRAPMQEPVR